ncbi:hypothetical protein AB0M20_45340, partial [Actinoplanes sp. NPDC051633]|uniref:hypothetical protein n=1 Tax=Actinoplanes sp. NPDC051633 TaxID=3155670 RepID=UPI003446785F
MSGFGRRRIIQGGLLGAAAGLLGPGLTRPAAALPLRAESWPFPEHRTAARLAADRVHAARQVEALSSPAARLRASRILDRIRARQDAAPARYALPFDRVGEDVLVARRAPLDQVIKGDDHPIVTLGYTLKGDDHPVVTLGYTVKGDDHPVVTSSMFAPQALVPAPVRVALVDTGLSAERRRDGWLAGTKAAPEHIDPLDVMPAAGRL